MKVLSFILQKEFRQIFRDRTILAMMFAVPIIQLIIFPLAANFEVKNINLAFVDYDRSTYSQKLLNKIASSGYFHIVGNTISYNDALQMIEKVTGFPFSSTPTVFTGPIPTSSRTAGSFSPARLPSQCTLSLGLMATIPARTG